MACKDGKNSAKIYGLPSGNVAKAKANARNLWQRGKCYP